MVGELIAVGWARPTEDIRPPLQAFLAEVSREPGTWLETLSKIHMQAAVLIEFVLHNLRANLSSLGGSAALQCTGDDVPSAIADFLDVQTRMTYTDFRKILLDFCVAEMIAPETVASAVEGRREYFLNTGQHLSETITADVPLLCVCMAHRIFWA